MLPTDLKTFIIAPILQYQNKKTATIKCCVLLITLMKKKLFKIIISDLSLSDHSHKPDSHSIV